MSFKSKIIGAVASIAVEKIAESGKVDNVINTAIGKLGKSAGWEANGIKIDIKRNNCIVIKTRSYSISTIAKASRGILPDVGELWGKYKIFDSSNSIRYVSELRETSLLEDFVGYDKDTLYIFDTNNKKIGKIKENVFSYRMPILEKDAKRCTAFLNGNEYFEAKRYYSFFNELCHDITGCDYSISQYKGKDIEIKKGNQAIADVHKISPAFKDDFTEKYIVEFDNIEDEIPILFLTLALDILGQ